MVIYNSTFKENTKENEDGVLHRAFREYLDQYGPVCLSHLDAIDREIEALKEKGVDILYSARVHTDVLKKSQV